MHSASFPSYSRMQSAFPENVQHRGVLRQTFGDQFLEPGITGDRGKMTHQCRADPLSMVFVDQRESHLSSSGLKDDIASTSHDNRSFTFVCNYDQGNMA